MAAELAVRFRVEMALRGRRPTDVAEAAGISPSTLSRILHGKQLPSEDLVRRIETAIHREAGAA